MNDTEFAKVMAFLTGAYPERKLSHDTITVYAICLKDLPFEAAKGAIIKHIGQNKWFPTIAELREAALAVMPGNELPTSLEAWREVTQAFSDVGYYGEPEWSHAAIKATVDAFGWRTMCLSENAQVLEARFAQMYREYAARLRDKRLELPVVAEVRVQLASGENLRELPEKIRRLSDAKRVS